MTPIGRLVIVGVGLIGGSFAAALRARGLVRHVVGVGRSAANLEAARSLHIIDDVAGVAAAVRDADFVLVATPVGQMQSMLAAMRDHLAPHAVVTDGGSTKALVVELARAALGDRIAQFVPGHPIAGSDRSGAAAANARLYHGRRVVLTPVPENAAVAVARVREAWQACGAEVVEMSPGLHDATLATMSHLPHVIAYAMMQQVLDDPERDTLLDNAGPGFRDFTRLASSQPEMWRDILLSNRDALLAAMDRFDASARQLRTAIEQSDAAWLDALFTRSRAERDAWLVRFDAKAKGAA